MLLRRKVSQIGLIIIVFLTGGLFIADTVSAQVSPEDSNNLVVKFNPDDPSSDKLFNVINFLPGDSENSSVYVENNNEGVGEETITIEAINVDNDVINIVTNERFGDALDLTINEGSKQIFEGTLTEFFDAKKLPLSNLGNGTNTTYDFLVVFRESVSEKYYQGKSLGFDVVIGFQGGESVSDGDGGGRSSQGLIIKYVKAYDITENSAKVKWRTSYNATSQVIYCKESENCSLKLGDNAGIPPLYGYNYTTSEENAPANQYGVTYHEITIKKLQENTTYDFRCISHASPPTVSRGYSFTTLASSDGNDVGDNKKEDDTDANGFTSLQDNGASVDTSDSTRDNGASANSADDDSEKTGLIPSVKKVFNSANNFIGSVLGSGNINEIDEGNTNFKQGEEIGSSFKGNYSNFLLLIILLFLAVIILFISLTRERIAKRKNIFGKF